MSSKYRSSKRRANSEELSFEVRYGGHSFAWVAQRYPPSSGIENKYLTSEGQRSSCFVPVPIKSGRDPVYLRRLSSAVEHLFCKQVVVGSNPTVGSES